MYVCVCVWMDGWMDGWMCMCVYVCVYMNVYVNVYVNVYCCLGKCEAKALGAARIFTFCLQIQSSGDQPFGWQAIVDLSVKKTMANCSNGHS